MIKFSILHQTVPERKHAVCCWPASQWHASASSLLLFSKESMCLIWFFFWFWQPWKLTKVLMVWWWRTSLNVNWTRVSLHVQVVNNSTCFTRLSISLDAHEFCSSAAQLQFVRMIIELVWCWWRSKQIGMLMMTSEHILFTEACMTLDVFQ